MGMPDNFGVYEGMRGNADFRCRHNIPVPNGSRLFRMSSNVCLNNKKDDFVETVAWMKQRYARKTLVHDPRYYSGRAGIGLDLCARHISGTAQGTQKMGKIIFISSYSFRTGGLL